MKYDLSDRQINPLDTNAVSTSFSRQYVMFKTDTNPTGIIAGVSFQVSGGVVRETIYSCALDV
jgi:hypothetical protein